MNNRDLQAALKWGIENSSASAKSVETAPRTQLTSESLAALFAAADHKSDVDYMNMNMKVILDAEMEMKDRVQAFDNFQQLIENLDNANNMEPAGLWVPLVKTLDDEHPDIRWWAAWCCGTAVQNNIRTQERLLVCGAIPILVRLATQDTEQKVRKKAIMALSSTVRNFQAGLDETVTHMPDEYKPTEKLDANDMDSVDSLINKLRDGVQGSA